MGDEHKYAKHLLHYERVRKIIPNQSQTLSKSPGQFRKGTMPLFSARAKGAYIWDITGNKLLDYMGALGPIILGYADTVTDNAIKKQLKDGIIFSQPHPLEFEVAKLITQLVPGADMVRFGKNGSDATSGAVRIARAYTKRDVILFCGYHGAQDWYIVSTERSAGVPRMLKQLVHGFEYNNLDSLEKLFTKFPGKVAAVIMEPAYAEHPKGRFLADVKRLAHAHGALLIFDEVITGFRWSSGGAQKYFGVTPDLSCFGKSIANGMPLSAIAGTRTVMQKTEDVFFSFTYGGECLSLAAAKAVLSELKRNPGILKHVWRMGEKLQKGIQKSIESHGLSHSIACVGFPPRPIMQFYKDNGESSPELRALFQQYIIDAGILYSTYWNITYAHREHHIAFTLRAVDEALRKVKHDIAEGVVLKKVGRSIAPVFAMHAGGKKA
ncbi:MAG: aminotransferase class III-fold pyridoxal phosphate-dependent enzyme [Candidatus Taylorbacteria bacterium]|nr:aminotransferase class III-fold pyridoxal phosphate-dependent enzyme [Candidatus Taylorbacteria bacterium]